MVLQVNRFSHDKSKSFAKSNEWICKNAGLIEVRDIQLRTDNSGEEFVLVFYFIDPGNVEKLK